MKRTFYLIFSVFLIFAVPSSAQEKTNKSLQSEKKIQTKNSLEEKLNSKEFEFLALRAIPSGHAMVDLVGNNYGIIFTKDRIKSHLPYYGTQRRGSTFGRDQGMRFHGKPKAFVISKSNKGFLVEAEVQNDKDVFSISMLVDESGNASVTIITKNKSVITYEGEIR